MSEELNDELESTNQPEVEETQETPEDSEESKDDVEALKEQNKKLFERAKTAEAKLKELKPKVEPKPETPPSDPGLPIADIIALSKIHEEDVEEVVNYAKFKKIPVKEALKLNVIKTLLNDRAEERKTAEATAKGSQRRSSATVSDESLLDNASTGKVPDSDDEIARLAKARIAALKK